ncbi:MAG: ATP synthase F1 subunit epsilon [Candidatus Paceibacterota bacterium]
MLNKQLQLTIARVDAPVFSGAVTSVTVPGSEGEMTLLADHTPLMTALRAGTITVRKADGETETFPVTSGTLEVSQNQVTILL